MNKKNTARILFVVIPLIAVCGIAITPSLISGDLPGTNDLNAAGRDLFYKHVSMELLRHPRTFSLESEDVKRILAADTELKALYASVTRLIYLERINDAPAPPDSAQIQPSDEFRAAWLDICREGAERFVSSLFIREPMPAVSAQTVLEQVTSDLGINPVANALKSKSPPRTESQYKTALSQALRAVNAQKANAISAGAGVKIAVIGPGIVRSASSKSAEKPPWTSSLPAGTNQLRAWDAKAAAAAAPDAEVTSWPLIWNSQSSCRYWSALQTALAIRSAIRSDARILVVTNSFSLDYPCLRDACLEAYLNNRVIICGIGKAAGVDPEVPQSFPAHYNTTVAVAGVFMDRYAHLTPRPEYASSHFTDLSAPAGPYITIVPEIAAGLCGAAAALIAAKMPPVPEDLSGQYFQRIREVLIRSAAKHILQQKHFDPPMGYGLLDIENAVGKELNAYLVHRKKIEEDYKRRLAERAKAQEEADKAGKKEENSAK